ncbi:uncharacterized protein LOC143583734 [Bidens hawaiensis]|uniref:uncharacterized protein LOC143583734 n=1 Tax=Bidens hawaiensis TaxID=980011 RepID=UPI00404B3F94
MRQVDNRFRTGKTTPFITDISSYCLKSTYDRDTNLKCLELYQEMDVVSIFFSYMNLVPTVVDLDPKNLTRQKFMPEGSSRYQPPPPRRKTPSFSSSLLDSILRSIDETTDAGGGGGLRPQLHHHHDHDIMLNLASQPKRTTKEEEHTPSLRRAIMIDDTHNNNNNNRSCYVSKKSCSSSTSSETPSTYRSLPNSFTISRDDIGSEAKFMKSTKLKAMKIYGDLKKVKQPISPGSRISAFICSLFASSSKKKAKKQQDTTTAWDSFSRSCMSKKQHSNSHVKRSVRFYPENDTVIIHERGADSTPVPKYERRWFTEKNYNNNNFVVNVEDEDEDEGEDDDLFELEIVTGAYRQELPVFETTDLRKIRI